MYLVCIQCVDRETQNANRSMAKRNKIKEKTNTKRKQKEGNVHFVNINKIL